MNNETNQNIINNQLPNINNQTVVPTQVIQQQVNPPTQQVNTSVVQQQNNNQILNMPNQQTNNPPKVDFNSLSPLEKKQLIEKAIKEAELKCKIEKPKGYTKLNLLCICMVLLCIVCVIILNILK